MAEELEKLRAKGYEFEVAEEPITEVASQYDVYYRVTIKHRGMILGTRSEVTRERAFERARLLAERHARGEDIRTLLV
jgi:hypothetical protein